MKRFWSKVNKNGPLPPKHPELGPCWIWTAGCSGDGYGAFWLLGKIVRAHRLSLTFSGVDIPEGMQPDHLCEITKCVRPSHLNVTTPQNNVLRTDSPPAVNARKTHCINGHPLSGDNLVVIPNRRRQCLECRRDNRRRFRSRHRKEENIKARERALKYYYANRSRINAARRAAR